MKSLPSARVSLLRLVSLAVFIGVVNQFLSDFFNEVTLFEYLRNDSLVFVEIPLFLVFGLKGPQNREFCIVLGIFFSFYFS